MKQTAVEWLHEKLAQSSQEELVVNINLWFKQAKEMEKQQIIDANTVGVNQGLYGYKNAKEYYNKNFKNK